MISPGEIYEIAQLHIRPDSVDEFAAVAVDALDILEAAPGCGEARLLLGIEEPQEPRFVIRWDSVEAHESFRETPTFADYRATISDHFAAPPTYSHFEVGPVGGGGR